MTKTKIIFQEMISQNQVIFDSFKKIHDQYVTNPKEWKIKFNEEGQKILDLIRTYEGRLCAHTENGGYGRYSTNLADKFWQEIRNYLPRIDEVGIL